ncbi:hypothetical protein BDY19DRAFT_1058875 [Irpex rosettiformis]|uniref:Uncharacterized protein n=1 Tax=Irpex rosettiformis TaxID=378272 RepID=A0ACB8TWF6_9APHY|nr:hypothetical protein BDY19DRAFT_1058875 [Irpex rosettiformis]
METVQKNARYLNPDVQDVEMVVQGNKELAVSELDVEMGQQSDQSGYLGVQAEEQDANRTENKAQEAQILRLVTQMGQLSIKDVQTGDQREQTGRGDAQHVTNANGGQNIEWTHLGIQAGARARGLTIDVQRGPFGREDVEMEGNGGDGDGDESEGLQLDVGSVAMDVEENVMTLLHCSLITLGFAVPASPPSLTAQSPASIHLVVTNPSPFTNRVSSHANWTLSIANSTNDTKRLPRIEEPVEGESFQTIMSSEVYILGAGSIEEEKAGEDEYDGEERVPAASYSPFVPKDYFKDISSNNSGDSADSSESSPNHLPDILDSADDFALEHNPETTLGEIVDSLIKLADEDHLQASTEQVPADSAVDKAGTGTELDVEPEISSTPNSPAPNAGIYEGNGLPFRLDIADLFNFSESYWVSVIEKQAESGLADEAELCELLGEYGADSTSEPVPPNFIVGNYSESDFIFMECPPSPLVIVPYRPYKLPKRQFGRKHEPLAITFTMKGQPGVSLGLSAGAPAGIDYSHQPVFEGCGTKVTFVIQIGKLNPYKPQKYAYSRRNGEQTANNRAMVVKQISEVMKGFIETIRWEQGEGASWFMEGGIKIKDLYLTELRQVGKASFQPIFAVAEEMMPFG